MRQNVFKANCAWLWWARFVGVLCMWLYCSLALTQSPESVRNASRLKPASSVVEGAGKRVALLIGNSNYNKLRKLANPKNDVSLMEKTLRELGFTEIVGGVKNGLDLNHGDMLELLNEFGQRASGADVAVVFFAGHGLVTKLSNEQYLAGVESSGIEARLAAEALSITNIMDTLSSYGAAKNFVFLDACRESARGGGMRSVVPKRDAPNTVILYATAADDVAADGEGHNSPFTQALAQEIKQPQEWAVVQRSIINTVLINTRQRQEPKPYGSLREPMYFNKNITVNVSQAIAPSSQLFPVVSDSVKVIDDYEILDDPDLGKASLARDPKTGLIWQRCSVGQKWNGTKCTGIAKTMTFDEAQKLSGDGWHVPTIQDLMSLIDCQGGELKKESKSNVFSCEETEELKKYGLAINKEVFPWIEVVRSDGFWWSSSIWGDQDANIVDFLSGFQGIASRSDLLKVRLVRVSPAGSLTFRAVAPSVPTAQVIDGYEILNDPNLGQGSLARDLNTGYVWQRCSVGQKWNGQTCTGESKKFTYENAHKLAFKGLWDATPTGWRVPTARELRSIVVCSTNRTKAKTDLGDTGPRVKNQCAGEFQKPTVNIKVFPQTPLMLFWTSSPSFSYPVFLANFVNGSIFSSRFLSEEIEIPVRLIQGYLHETRKSMMGNFEILDDPDLGEGSLARDLRTGLEWQRCRLGQRWTGTTCAGEQKNYYFSDAQKFSNKVWRLPTLREFNSLTHCANGVESMIDPEDGGEPVVEDCKFDSSKESNLLADAVFPNVSGSLWTASTDVGGSDKTWTFSFSSYGRIISTNSKETEKLSMQLVRGYLLKTPKKTTVDEREMKNYEILDDPILGVGSLVKDKNTNLIWQRCSVGQRWTGTTCAGEVTYFEFNDLQKLTDQDWRVPTVRELASLVACSSGEIKVPAEPEDLGDGKESIESSCEGSYQRPTVHRAIFPHTVENSYWTSSRSFKYPERVWRVHFSFGSIGNAQIDSKYLYGAVRLVRAR